MKRKKTTLRELMDRAVKKQTEIFRKEEQRKQREKLKRIKRKYKKYFV